MILESFLKAFDTIRYKTVLGFSNEYLTWTISYLTGGRHFVQIDDRKLNMAEVNFGVLQGSMMGPLLFNLYMGDLEAHINTKCHQYADNTTLSTL